MKILLKNATVYNPNSSYHLQETNILLEDSLIKAIGNNIKSKANHTISGNKLGVSAGWVDLNAHFCDPGLEHKETLESGSIAAAKSGFTKVLLMPNTQPVVQTKSAVQYICNASKVLPIDLLPIGAVSEDLDGKNMTEFADMKAAGAIAFSDGDQSIQAAGLMERCMLYAKSLGCFIIQWPNDTSFSPDSIINESANTVHLGLKSSPAIAELISVQRDIELCKHNDTPLHFMGVSGKESIIAIHAAQQAKHAITASINAWQLTFTDSDLIDYDSQLKLKPFLREKHHQDALKMAVKNGTISIISSGHRPHEADAKDVEFEYADFGMIGLETSFASAYTALRDELSTEQIVNCFSTNPRGLLGLEEPTIEEGEQAELTIFDTDVNWTFKLENIHSKSKNTPFVGKKFSAKVLGTYYKGNWNSNE